jgi:hypothetical protein
MKIHYESEALIEYEEAAQYAEDRFGCGQKAQRMQATVGNAPV